MDKNISFVNNRNIKKLLESSLSSMSKILFIENGSGDILLKKDDFQFGFIKEGNLFLLGNDSKYYQLKKAILLNSDELLHRSTGAFWLASGKRDFFDL